MTDNEKIARWAGWKREDDKGGWWSVPGVGRRSEPPDIQHDITLWHSESGLLAEIEQRLKKPGQNDFLEQIAVAIDLIDSEKTDVMIRFMRTNPWELAWAILNAAPAQLAEALVKIIDKESE